MRGPHHRLLTDVAGDREETKGVGLDSETSLGAECELRRVEGLRIRVKDRKRKESMCDEKTKR